MKRSAPSTTSQDPGQGGAPEEDPSDPFDRQRCIQNWNQSKVEHQVCLVLGVGGLGCSVAFTLARLGVGRIILLDRDVVDTSNLNRQMLFGKQDVGKPKVVAAARALESCHVVGKTAIDYHNMDAVKEWGAVVQLAKQASCIFNNIDVGDHFDYAVRVLAKALKVPYSSGSSYSSTWLAEHFNPGAAVSAANLRPEVVSKLNPATIFELPDLNFLPADCKPPTRQLGSSALVCCTAGIMVVNSFIQSLFDKPVPSFVKVEADAYWQETGVVALVEQSEEERKATARQ